MSRAGPPARRPTRLPAPGHCWAQSCRSAGFQIPGRGRERLPGRIPHPGCRTRRELFRFPSWSPFERNRMVSLCRVETVAGSLLQLEQENTFAGGRKTYYASGRGSRPDAHHPSFALHADSRHRPLELWQENLVPQGGSCARRLARENEKPPVADVSRHSFAVTPPLASFAPRKGNATLQPAARHGAEFHGDCRHSGWSTALDARTHRSLT